MTPTTRPSLPRRAITYELAMWRSLYRWVLRRPPDMRPGGRAFSYVGVVLPILGVFIGLSAIEVPIVHLILPWPTVRNVSLALGIYGVLWMIGMLASYKVYPHLVDSAGLHLRGGVSLRLTVGWDEIAQIRHRYRSLPPGRSIQVEQSSGGAILHLGMGNQTSVEVTLRQPTSFRLPKGPSEPVTELRFYADDPNGMVAFAREHLGSAQATERSPGS